MDFDAAILAHVNWKKKFNAHLDGTEKIDAKTAAAANLCALGKWIHSSPLLHSMTEFKALEAAHADFHKQAGLVVAASATCNPAEARKLVELSTPFGKASAACVNAITTLRDKMKTEK